jgi:hypothetical protein
MHKVKHTNTHSNAGYPAHPAYKPKGTPQTATAHAQSKKRKESKARRGKKKTDGFEKKKNYCEKRNLIMKHFEYIIDSQTPNRIYSRALLFLTNRRTLNILFISFLGTFKIKR